MSAETEKLTAQRPCVCGHAQSEHRAFGGLVAYAECRAKGCDCKHYVAEKSEAEKLISLTRTRRMMRFAGKHEIALADALAAAEARAEEAEKERDEWKNEADRSKWPKEDAQEFFRLRAEEPRLIARALAAEAREQRLREALRPFKTAADAFDHPFEHGDGISRLTDVEWCRIRPKIEEAIYGARAVLAADAEATP